MVGLFLENGPCEVVEVAKNEFATKARVWGWDRSSNMLYIDQVCRCPLDLDERVSILLAYKLTLSHSQRKSASHTTPFAMARWISKQAISPSHLHQLQPTRLHMPS
jgi:hypothetical protein